MIKKPFISLTILTLIMLVSAGTGSYAQEEGFPVIAHIQGEVFMNLKGEEWEPARVDVVLDPETLIKTGNQAFCNIVFDKDYKNVVSVGSDTEIKIGQYVNRVHITRGRVFSQLENLKEGSKFEIVTPVAIAGARGTAWETIVNDGGVVKFNVNKNSIYVKGFDKDGQLTGEIEVSEGFAVSVDEQGWISQLFKVLEKDNDRLEDWSNKVRTSLHVSHYSGDLNKLFAQLLETETPNAEEAFASGENEGLGGGGSSSAPNLLGGDITSGTFVIKEVKTETLPVPPPPPPPPRPTREDNGY